LKGEEKMEKLWTILKWEGGKWIILEEFYGNLKKLSDHLNGLMKFHKGVKFDAIPNDRKE